MITIPITLGLTVSIDDEDYDLVGRHTWHAQPKKGGANHYAITNIRPIPGENQTTVRMHRLIVGARPGEHVDHIDGNGLNNCRSNLRKCSNTENCQNQRKILRTTTSRFKGVTRRKDNGKWHAHIKINGRENHLGFFLTEEAAAIVYDAKARHHFGQFAALNLPLPGERSALTGEIVRGAA